MPGRGVIPTIRVDDVSAALAFYRDVLGFTVERESPENSVVTLGDARLMVEPPGAFYSDAYNARIRERLGSRSPNALYVEATDLDEPLMVEDPFGNWLTFWTRL